MQNGNITFHITRKPGKEYLDEYL
jgi:hypothetical protein